MPELTPAHSQAIEALRETRDALDLVMRSVVKTGAMGASASAARSAIVFADYVLALQSREGAR